MKTKMTRKHQSRCLMWRKRCKDTYSKASCSGQTQRRKAQEHASRKRSFTLWCMLTTLSTTTIDLALCAFLSIRKLKNRSKTFELWSQAATRSVKPAWSINFCKAFPMKVRQLARTFFRAIRPSISNRTRKSMSSSTISMAKYTMRDAIMLVSAH